MTAISTKGPGAGRLPGLLLSSKKSAVTYTFGIKHRGEHYSLSAHRFCQDTQQVLIMRHAIEFLPSICKVGVCQESSGSSGAWSCHRMVTSEVSTRLDLVGNPRVVFFWVVGVRQLSRGGRSRPSPISNSDPGLPADQADRYLAAQPGIKTSPENGRFSRLEFYVSCRI